MEENLSQYKCPNCSAPLTWSPKRGKLFCSACGSEFEADENTAATKCPYCGNNVILNDKLTGGLRPNGIIPFRIASEELPAAPLVVDRAGLLTIDQRQELNGKLRALREKYNCDFVFFSDLSTYGFSRRVYAADFYVFNGHGLGDDFSGMILFVSMEWGNRGWWSAATGSCRSLFTEENVNRLDDRLEPYMVDGNYGQGILCYFDDIDRMFATGRAPRPISSTVIILIVSLAVGALAGWITVRSLRGAMTTVKEASDADEYLIPESFILRNQRDFFLRSTVSRTKIERSSSGGGGGSSSYSGSYSSSSGCSFSGGGRSF